LSHASKKDPETPRKVLELDYLKEKGLGISVGFRVVSDNVHFD